MEVIGFGRRDGREKMPIIFSRFGGIQPSIDPLRLGVGAAQVATGLDFRRGIYAPGYTSVEVPSSRIEGENGAAARGFAPLLSVGEQRFARFPNPVDWEVFGDREPVRDDGGRVLRYTDLNRRIVVCGDGYPKWRRLSDSGYKRLGFVARDVSGLGGGEIFTGAPDRNTPQLREDALNYLFGVTFLNSAGDESPIIYCNSVYLREGDNVGFSFQVQDWTDDMDNPNYTGEEFTKYRVWASTGEGLSYAFIGEWNFNVNGGHPQTGNFSISERFATSSLRETGEDKTPPENMRGIKHHQNGFAVAYAGRELIFSEINRPGRYPTTWRRDVGFEIDAIELFENTIYICGLGRKPLSCVVNHPSQVIIREIEQNFTYIGGMARINREVLYASAAGIVGMRSGLIMLGAVNERTMGVPQAAASYEDNYEIFFDNYCWRLDFRPVRLLLGGVVPQVCEMERNDGINVQSAFEYRGVLYQLTAGGKIMQKDERQNRQRASGASKWVSRPVRLKKPQDFAFMRVDMELSENRFFFGLGGLRHRRMGRSGAAGLMGRVMGAGYPVGYNRGNINRDRRDFFIKVYGYRTPESGGSLVRHEVYRLGNAEISAAKKAPGGGIIVSLPKFVAQQWEISIEGGQAVRQITLAETATGLDALPKQGEGV